MIKRNGKIRVWEPLMVGIAAAIGLLAGYNIQFDHADYSLLQYNKAFESPRSLQKDGKIEEILRFIETNYVDSLDNDIVAIDAIRHILKQLDPHSDYITPEELQGHNERMDGAYRGIGIETIKMLDTFYITQIVEGGPSDAAGLKLGDAILSVDGVQVSGNETPFHSVREMLKEESKDSLELEISSIGSRFLTKEIVQIENIEIASANESYLISDDLLYLRLERFSGNTYEQFIESLDAVAADQKKMHLILDLRDNPGGYLPEAIKILSQLFQEKDKLLTYTEGLNRKKAEYRTTGKSFYNIGKIAVLINGNSASGSEILAGAIQDWDRGIIIGEESFGKGLVQEIFPLRNGGALRLTVAKYYTPTGRLIQKSYRSINKDFVADSIEFETRLLNRTVESGNGIIPDVLIASDDHNICDSHLSYADFFIIRTMRNNGSVELTENDFSVEAYTSFLSELHETEEDISLDQCKQEYASDFIYNRYIRLMEGGTAYLKAMNSGDPYIKASLNFIEDKQTTLALLSKEN
ncbi:MAG: PDZ domain-containing protein [Saprospiraceae bacterium]|nr:PDZ domain-containing protein [Saprospiraceae bacterium]